MHNLMMAVARVMAVLGGIVLTALILLTCLSVLGRSLNGLLHGEFFTTWLPGFSQWALDMGIGPVNGDFELVEAGVAFSIFAFLPLCQITSGHASVDIFANQFPAGLNRFLRGVIEIVFAAALVLIAVQLYEGMLSKRQYNETTFLLQFPIWWAYAASLFGAAVSAVVGIYMACIRTLEFFTGRVILADGPEADH